MSDFYAFRATSVTTYFQNMFKIFSNLASNIYTVSFGVHIFSLSKRHYILKICKTCSDHVLNHFDAKQRQYPDKFYVYN